MTYDLFIEERVASKGEASYERWRHQVVVADNDEDLMNRIRDLKLRGKFRVYPQDAGIMIRAHVVELYEVERLR